ncbi:hypothetical protein L6452_38991 [Arctium lappa]|uniref:Uncharacterized protein n=1 Tax=Arctium lappa TaxID=4217 RepID=A0ACB8XR34_ARCLA|nr:hypothetical protein L6452_38991 [Arctium lappa]
MTSGELVIARVVGWSEVPSKLGRVLTYAGMGIWVRTVGKKLLGHSGTGLEASRDRMAITRRNNNVEPNTGTGLTTEQIREMIATEVTHAIGEAIPEIITAIRNEVVVLMEEHIAAIPPSAGGQPRAREFQYRDLSACSPPEFKGDSKPIVSMRWISDMECAFLTSGCPENLKVRFAVNLLRDGAKDWCATALTLAERTTLTWEEFVIRFRAEYVPPVEMERIAKEFLELTQTTETVKEMNRRFTEMALFCLQYAASEDMKMTRYKDMLRTEIREFVSTAQYATLVAMMEAARRQELELETQAKKRKAAQAVAPISVVPKKVRFSDSRTGQRSGGFKPMNSSGGRDNKCFKCGQVGHYGRDCRVPLMVCFNCKQTGHVKANCLYPRATDGGGAPRAPTAVPLRITDGRVGQAGTEAARGRVHQLKVDEAQATPKVVTGTFLINSVPAVVMFDSGATHSFVSHTFSKCLGCRVGRLGCPLVVEVADDRTLTVIDVYRGCTLEISGVRFPIDLIPIAMRELCVIVGMDWMEVFDAEIVCRRKQVRVRTPSGGELLVQGDSPRRTSAICSAARARRYLQHSGQGYLAYVIDTRGDGEKKTVEDVPVVREFADVFPDDLPGIPPERQVEFRIDLVPGAAPVAKAPYRLPPPEMKELYTQLQELLKRSSSSRVVHRGGPRFYL